VSSEAALRVFLVDDHPVFRSGVVRTLEADGRFVVVGEAEDAPTARARMPAHTDVAIIDLSLRNGSGLDLVAALRAERTRLRILVLSMHDPDLYAERALRAGASGYLGKEAAPGTLCEAIWRVAHGGLVMSEALQESMVRRALNGQNATTNPLDTLSNREMDVLRLIAEGVGPSEIARTLFLSVKTVETHRSNIKRKLGIRTGAALLRAALAAFPNAVPEAGGG
jgi:DNA-binding NarL/FixJ family response regulator